MTPQTFEQRLSEAAEKFEDPYKKDYKPVSVDCICHQELFHSEYCIKNIIRAQPRIPTFQQRLEACFKSGARFGIEQVIEWIKTHERLIELKTTVIPALSANELASELQRVFLEEGK